MGECVMAGRTSTLLPALLLVLALESVCSTRCYMCRDVVQKWVQYPDTVPSPPCAHALKPPRMAYPLGRPGKWQSHLFPSIPMPNLVERGSNEHDFKLQLCTLGRIPESKIVWIIPLITFIIRPISICQTWTTAHLQGQVRPAQDRWVDNTVHRWEFRCIPPGS